MKKLIIGLVVLIVIALTAIYIIIPGKLTVSDFEKIQCSLPGANRVLAQPENWKKLWHNDSNKTTPSALANSEDLIFNNDTFRITKVLQNGLEINVSGEEINTTSRFSLLPLTQDSIAINWVFEMETSANPAKRIQQYNQAVHLKKSMESVLRSIKEYLSKNEMVYGFPITETSTQDTLLISTKKEFTSQPSSDDIYLMIEKLQTYASANNAKQTNAPMMNVTPIDANHFMVMTAIPVDKTLNGNENISYKRMIPGKFLTTTITGGNQTIEATQKGMQQYFQDYGRVAMAIPFMYLVTDRRKETDSSKWVTKLYFPVM